MTHGECQRFREQASEFADDRLEAAELVRLERHLAACPGCARFETELRRLQELLQAAEAFRPLRRPSPAFTAAVMRRVRGEAPGLAPEPAALPWWRAVWAQAGLALAAALVALVFAWSWQRLLQAPDAGPAAVAVRPAAEEGSMETYLRQHALLARDATLLGPAEEVEFAGFRTAGGSRR